MNFLKRIFKSNKNVSVDSERLLPKVEIPVDEKFTINFKSNGGKFLYCISLDEVYDNIDQIIKENAWEDDAFFYVDSSVPKKLSAKQIQLDPKQGNIFICSCEYLIAENGSILISSNQIKEKKLQDLPENFIVFATISQIVNSLGEGLRGIKAKNKTHIPTNITTIKHFQNQKENNDFLSYGSTSKNLYLLLLEDL